MGFFCVEFASTLLMLQVTSLYTHGILAGTRLE